MNRSIEPQFICNSINQGLMGVAVIGDVVKGKKNEGNLNRAVLVVRISSFCTYCFVFLSFFYPNTYAIYAQIQPKKITEYIKYDK